MKKTFTPIVKIPVVKNQGFGKQNDFLWPDMDYVADKFIMHGDGKITFTLNDKQGWIGDYETNVKHFNVEQL